MAAGATEVTIKMISSGDFVDPHYLTTVTLPLCDDTSIYTNPIVNPSAEGAASGGVTLPDVDSVYYVGGDFFGEHEIGWCFRGRKGGG